MRQARAGAAQHMAEMGLPEVVAGEHVHHRRGVDALLLVDQAIDRMHRAADVFLGLHDGRKRLHHAIGSRMRVHLCTQRRELLAQFEFAVNRAHEQTAVQVVRLQDQRVSDLAAKGDGFVDSRQFAKARCRAFAQGLDKGLAHACLVQHQVDRLRGQAGEPEPCGGVRVRADIELAQVQQRDDVESAPHFVEDRCQAIDGVAEIVVCDEFDSGVGWQRCMALCVEDHAQPVAMGPEGFEFALADAAEEQHEGWLVHERRPEN